MFFGIALALLLLIIANLSGQNPQLREGAEQFLSRITNSRAVIGKLEYLGFIPDIRIDIKDVSFQTQGDPTDTPMKMEHLTFSLPTTHYLLNKKTIETISATNVEARAGFITPKSLAIENANIADNKLTAPHLQVEGKYGGEEFSARIELLPVLFKEGRMVYRLADVTPVFFQTELFDITAELESVKHGSRFKNIVLVHKEAGEVTADITLTYSDEGALVYGTVSKGHSSAEISLDVSQDDEETALSMSGDVQSDAMDAQDFVAIDTAISGLMAFFAHDQGGQRFFDVNGKLDIHVQEMKCGENSTGPIRFGLDVDDTGGKNTSLWDTDAFTQAGLTGDSPCAKYFEDYLKPAE